MWQRVPSASARTVANGAGFAGSVLFAILTPVAAVAALASGDLRDGAGLAVVSLFIGAWSAAMFRLARAGVFIDPSGVRVRRVSGTTTIPWHDVAAVESRPGHVFGVGIRRDAIHIVRTTGAVVETPVQRRAGRWSPGSFDPELTLLAPPAYDRALAVLRRGPTSG